MDLEARQVGSLVHLGEQPDIAVRILEKSSVLLGPPSSEVPRPYAHEAA